MPVTSINVYSVCMPCNRLVSLPGCIFTFDLVNKFQMCYDHNHMLSKKLMNSYLLHGIYKLGEAELVCASSKTSEAFLCIF